MPEEHATPSILAPPVCPVMAPRLACFHCDGHGRFRAYRLRPDGKHELVYAVPCGRCEGTGKEPASKADAA